MFKDRTLYADLVEEGVAYIPEAIERSDAEGQLSDLLGVRVCLRTLRRVSRNYDISYGVPWDRFAVSCMAKDLEKQLEEGPAELEEELLAEALWPTS